jgi:hypothetical protein
MKMHNPIDKTKSPHPDAQSQQLEPPPSDDIQYLVVREEERATHSNHFLSESQQEETGFFD